MKIESFRNLHQLENYSTIFLNLNLFAVMVGAFIWEEMDLVRVPVPVLCCKPRKSISQQSWWEILTRGKQSVPSMS